MCTNVAAAANVAEFAVISLFTLVNDAAVVVVEVATGALIDVVAVVNILHLQMLLLLLLSVLLCLSMMLQLQLSLLLLCCE